MSDDIMKEMAWERRMMGLGQLEFDKKEEKNRTFTNTKTGQTILNELLHVYTDAIAVRQKELVTRDARGGTNRNNAGPLLLLEPEANALLALRVVLDNASTVGESSTKGIPIMLLAKRIASSIETEVNFRHWVSQSRAKARAWASEVGFRGTVQSAAEKMIKEYGVNRRSMFRWKRTFEELTEYEWDDEIKVHVGEELIVILAECYKNYFEIVVMPERGKTTKRFRKTEAFETELRRVHTHHKTAATLMMPMLTPPVPWVVV